MKRSLFLAPLIAVSLAVLTACSGTADTATASASGTAAATADASGSAAGASTAAETKNTEASDSASAEDSKTADSAPTTVAGTLAQSAAATNGGSNRLEEILERGYIEVATEPAFAPNEFIDPSKEGDEQYVGSDIELAKYIADALGVELRLKPMDFTSVLGSITTGKYDIAISALAYTPSRAESMNLSKGYYFGDEDPQKAYGVIIREADGDKIRTVEDFADKVVVTQNGSLQDQFVREQIPEYGKYNLVSSMTDAILMVQENRADAAAVHIKMAQTYIDSNPGCGLIIMPDFYFYVDPDTQGTRIGIPLGEDELTERINEIVDEVVEQDLYNQWYEEYREYAIGLGLDL